jgi:hypothetical protein
MPDIAYLSYQNSLAAVHAQAFSTCRSNEIPIAYVTPRMLRDRLKFVVSKGLGDMRLAIPPEDVMKYYKLKEADCVYTDDGGIIMVNIQLIQEKAKMEMYKVSSVLFKWEDEVCDVGIDEMFVLRDVTTMSVYPITDVGEETCSPFKTGKCQVPMVSIPLHLPVAN